MAKDYFQDITPPKQVRRLTPTSIPSSESPSTHMEADDTENDKSEAVPEKSIRNIQVPSVKPRPRVSDAQTSASGTTRAPQTPPRPPRIRMVKFGAPNLVTWIVAVVSVLVVGLCIFLFTRPTKITIIPRSQAGTFDQSVRTTVYPKDGAPEGALTYSVQTLDLEDSQVIQSTGSEHAEEKANGTLTVFNNYSTQSVRLIKNTRFESPSGLVFRTPADVVIPGKKGSTPGQVSITVVADAVGEGYNVPAADHWTVPGLKSNAPMYKGVYASSAAPMNGGFSGERAAFAPGALEAARAQIRSRLTDKARASVAAVNPNGVALPGLVHIVYQSGTPTQESGGGARVFERAHVEIPLLDGTQFARALAGAVSADAGTNPVTILFGNDFSAQFSDQDPDLTKPFQFTMAGSAMLVWQVDENGLRAALAGRDQTAFEAIVGTIPAIQEAHARLQPFWASKFPAADKIEILVKNPAS